MLKSQGMFVCLRTEMSPYVHIVKSIVGKKHYHMELQYIAAVILLLKLALCSITTSIFEGKYDLTHMMRRGVSCLFPYRS